ncbi:MAG: hypothetical protein MJ113_08215 [Lachnospiraceae bacterium]|nr:hypothetical protein [Lachnospiraceae bacterium]
MRSGFKRLFLYIIFLLFTGLVIDGGFILVEKYQEYKHDRVYVVHDEIETMYQLAVIEKANQAAGLPLPDTFSKQQRQFKKLVKEATDNYLILDKISVEEISKLIVAGEFYELGYALNDVLLTELDNHLSGRYSFFHEYVSLERYTVENPPTFTELAITCEAMTILAGLKEENLPSMNALVEEKLEEYAMSKKELADSLSEDDKEFANALRLYTAMANYHAAVDVRNGKTGSFIYEGFTKQEFDKLSSKEAFIPDSEISLKLLADYVVYGGDVTGNNYYKQNINTWLDEVFTEMKK